MLSEKEVQPVLIHKKTSQDFQNHKTEDQIHLNLHLPLQFGTRHHPFLDNRGVDSMRGMWRKEFDRRREE